MTKVVVFHDRYGAEGATYRAVAGGNQSMGRTAGEALDALTMQLSEEDADTLIVHLCIASASQVVSPED